MNRLVFFIFLLLITSTASAEDISISANNAIWNRKEGITILSGNVLITRGSISISASTMKVIGKLETLDEVIGEGNVRIIDKEKDIYLSGGYVKFCKPTEYILITKSPKLELKKEEAIITAMKMEGFYKKGEFVSTDAVKIVHKDTLVTAEKAVYSENKKRLELTGAPQVIQDKNKLTGKKIVYYLEEGRVEIIEGVKAVLRKSKD